MSEIGRPRLSIKLVLSLMLFLLIAMAAVVVFNVYQVREVRVLTDRLQQASSFDESRIDNLAVTVANQEVWLQSQQKAFNELSMTLTLDAANSQLFMQLSDVNQAVDQLTLIATKPMRAEVAPESEDSASLTGWKLRFQQLWHQFKAFIVIRHHVDEVTPMIANESGDYVYQYIHLQLGMAQWAVLHKNHEVYQTSLQQAKRWVERYFMANDSVTQDVLANLTQLQAPKE